MIKLRSVLLSSAVTAALFSGSVFAEKANNPFVITAGDGTAISLAELSDLRGAPIPPTAAAVTFEAPEGNVQTFGVAGSPENCLITVTLPAGTQVLGFSWDVRVETIGASWLVEAQTQFRTSDAGDPQVNLTYAPGAANQTPGQADASSGGVLLLADVAIPNIPVGGDGQFRMEFVDLFDDGPGADANLFNLPVGGDLGLTLACDNQAACDAAVLSTDTIVGSGACAGWNFTAGIPPQPLGPAMPIPTMQVWGLALLAGLMGLFAFSRRRSTQA